MTVVVPQRKNTLLYDTKSAISLLDGLQELCKENESLHSDLSHFQNRIRAVTPHAHAAENWPAMTLGLIG